MRWSGTTGDSPSISSRPAAASPLDRLLTKTVPVWFVAALVVFFALAAMAFGWYVKRSLYLDDRSFVARAGIAIASFPTDTKKVLIELGRALTGEANYRYVRAAERAGDLSGFAPVKSQLTTPIEGFVARSGPGLSERGWRVLVGAFEIGGSIEDAAVLLSPDLETVRYWLLAEAGPENTNPEPPSADLTHGFAMLRDGSVVFNSESASALRKLDSCGRLMWSTAGLFHHNVTADHSETTVWSLREESAGDRGQSSKIVQVAVDDGSIVREFSIADIIAANPGIDILELRREHQNMPDENDGGRPGRWLSDTFHLNDVDPLPPSMASRFPMFSAGDLLISARELNLIFVIDPSTLRVKWWRIGDTIRQHDPDWTADGRVSVYNNRMTRNHSEIVEIDPSTLAKTVAVNGSDIGFYARVGGKHQPMPGGNWLIASPWQGKIMETSPDGQIALEFRSVVNAGEPMSAVISEAIFLPEEMLDAGAFQCGGP